ncbi:hypothetical protein HYH03_006950 [Edaphochlamys debaryana]|uniref:Protein kinase domain-containing protein n=1 Tax=Edaphochlamys debaryana TaxID=47281 RepID=A0A835Y326_9CHLO|nr:hypothetical protein HYH03_006950 [Edaphochlamys debaryana]|eukprot:KAG2495018.1 hypothetical protein HYH03_006950 [Edaphochlamys debaryana]
MDAASVVECDPFQLTQGISLTTKELGRGSYGGSFRGLPVAVKVMVAPSLDRPALRELLLGPSVSHPNIVQTYTSRCATMSDEYFDFLEGGPRDRADQGLPRLLLDIPLHSGDGFGAPGVLEGDFKSSFLILHKVLVDLKEHADKGTLRSAIQGGMFAPREGWSLRVARRALLRTASEMARGMLHLHDVGLVHADLKPANVLLSNSPLDRRGCTAKVTDFGLSHVIPPNENSIRTDSWGSVAYMSPEAFAGSLSRAADVWAFGVILHEMLTGQRPFEGLKAPDAIQIIRNSPTPLTWPPNLPMSSGIVHLGRACLHRDPAQRPTMERVLHVLVGMEQCIRANLLLGPEAVTEILDSHGRDEDVTAIIERAIALARAVEAPPGAGGPAAPGNAAAAAAAAAAGAPVGPLTPSGSAALGLAGPGVRRTGSYSPQEQELA